MIIRNLNKTCDKQHISNGYLFDDLRLFAHFTKIGLQSVQFSNVFQFMFHSILKGIVRNGCPSGWSTDGECD